MEEFFIPLTERKILDTDKYYWVHSEMIAAAAGLHKLTNNTMYLEWYDKCWEYVIQNFSDEKNMEDGIGY